jgi:hypothetical protein
MKRRRRIVLSPVGFSQNPTFHTARTDTCKHTPHNRRSLKDIIKMDLMWRGFRSCLNVTWTSSCYRDWILDLAAGRRTACCGNWVRGHTDVPASARPVAHTFTATRTSECIAVRCSELHSAVLTTPLPLRGFGPLANHVDRATTASWRSSTNFCGLRVLRGQRNGSPRSYSRFS